MMTGRWSARFGAYAELAGWTAVLEVAEARTAVITMVGRLPMRFDWEEKRKKEQGKVKRNVKKKKKNNNNHFFWKKIQKKNKVLKKKRKKFYK